MLKVHFIYILIILALLGLFFSETMKKMDYKKDLIASKALNDREHQEFTTITNSLNQKITSQEAILISSKELENQLIQENKDLTKHIKSLEVVINIMSQTKYDTIKIPLPGDTIYTTTSLDSLIRVPKLVNVTSKWYSTDVQITKKSVDLINFTTHDTLSIVQGVYKSGLFKSSTQVHILTKNPYTTIVNTNSVIVQKHNKSFMTGVVIGLLTGLITYHYIK